MARLDALHVLSLLGSISDTTALDWSRSISSNIRKCSSGFDLAYALFNRAYFAHQVGRIQESHISIQNALGEYISDISSYGDWTAEALGLYAEILERKAKPENALNALLAQIELLQEAEQPSLITLDSGTSFASPFFYIEYLCSKYKLQIVTLHSLSF